MNYINLLYPVSKFLAVLRSASESITSTTVVIHPSQDELRQREFTRIEREAQARLKPELDRLYREYSREVRPASRRRRVAVSASTPSGS
jgi:hypothetical protein